MNNDPLRIFEPGFSGDSADRADTRAREVIDAWRDEWHLEPEPEMDGGNSKIYESLVARVASALSSRDAEVREALEGLAIQVPDGLCWCAVASDPHEPECLATSALYTKLQPKQ